jgi:predicted metal-dependent hydrolase
MKEKENTHTIMNLDGIGNVRFVRSYNSKYIRISIKPFEGIKVTVPAFVSIETARKFIEEKKTWVIKHTQKMAEKEKKTTLFMPDMPFKTRDHTLCLHTHDKRTIQIIVKSGLIYIFYPSFADICDEKIQRAIRKGILEAWRIEANKYLPQRVNELALKYGFSFKRLTFRNNKTRWGSCSRENNISLNIQLMRLPQHLTDYVILHELTHTVHKNHSSNFWQMLDKVTGNARKLDKELNNYRLEIW